MASDGLLSPAEVVARAAAAGLEAIALTDHDTLDGVTEACAAGERLGVRTIGGCEFSVAAPWGELHLLGYFLHPEMTAVESFLTRCREDRLRRVGAMVRALGHLGVPLSEEKIRAEAGTAALGRPHVARALVSMGVVSSVEEAFQKYLGRGRPACIDKRLPALDEVTTLLHEVGALAVAAHLGQRATRAAMVHLKAHGVDGIEAAHPSHSPEVRQRIERCSTELGLLVSGGSDWHGDGPGAGGHALIGSQDVPRAWLDAMDRARDTGIPGAGAA